jgi:hypothetical protein
MKTSDPFHQVLMLIAHNGTKMCLMRDGKGRSIRWFLLLTCAAAPIFWPSVARAGKQKADPETAGHFAVAIRGFWTGQGDATVDAATISIQGTVHDDVGRTGVLTATNLKRTGNHFSGAGTVFGITMVVEGRVDGGDPPPGTTGSGKGNGNGKGKGRNKGEGDNDTKQAPVVTNARIAATFVGAGHAVRVAGGRDQ